MTEPFDGLMETVVKENVSDVFLAPGRPAEIVLRGNKMALTTGPLDPQVTEEFIAWCAPEANQQALADNGETSFRLSYSAIRFDIFITTCDDERHVNLHRLPIDPQTD